MSCTLFLHPRFSGLISRPQCNALSLPYRCQQRFGVSQRKRERQVSRMPRVLGAPEGLTHFPPPVAVCVTALDAQGSVSWTLCSRVARLLMPASQLHRPHGGVSSQRAGMEDGRGGCGFSGWCFSKGVLPLLVTVVTSRPNKHRCTCGVTDVFFSFFFSFLHMLLTCCSFIKDPSYIF